MTLNIRWRLILPIVAVFASTMLMVIAAQQNWMFRGWDSPHPPTPAAMMNFMLNGPALLHLPFLSLLLPENIDRALNYQGERLLGIAIFWFLIGRAIDRKKAQRSFTSEHPIGALAVFGVLFALSGLLAFASWMRLSIGLSIALQIVRAQPLANLYTLAAVMGVWSIGLSVYFGRRIWQSIKALRRNGRVVVNVN